MFEPGGVEFRVLGPVEVSVPGRILVPPEPRQRAVLAALVVDAGRTVPTEVIIQRVWGESPPAQARRTLHSHLSRLRGLLDGTGAELVRAPGGYRLAVTRESVDVRRFEALAARARDGLSAVERAAVLRDALALWRGEPLGGLTGDWVEARRQAWSQDRVTVALAWAEAETEAGNADGVLGQLAQLSAEQPLVEPVSAMFVRALAGAGRTAQALAELARIRRRLRDELGCDPGPALQAVQRDVLRGAIQRDAVPAVPAGRTAERLTPAQLPADVVPFIGREAELDALDRLRPAVVVIAGTAGVGKTALAVRWAYRLATDFPDGQLYVNLRGYDPERPMTAAEALEGLLGGLLPSQASVPGGLAERTARFRSELAGRRMLLVLDNAATVEQVRPLLPGGTGCLVVVTSRDALAGLIARDGARRLDVDLLPAGEATALLERLIGDRAAADPAAVAALADMCARLPLALRVAAERAVTHPGVPLADLVAELADERRRLDLLAAGGDERTAVRSVFLWSVRELPPPAARLFRLLGRHPGPDIDGYAAAALLGAGLDAACDLLEVLARAYLVRATGAGRYDMHDLLRAYARDQPAPDAVDVPDADEAPDAVGRLLDHYLAAAARAMDEVYPAEKLRRPAPPEVSTPLPPITDASDALGWLDAERACLLAAGLFAAASGRPDHARDLSAMLFRYLDGRHHADALLIHEAALHAARQRGDQAGEALARNALGAACIQAGRHDAATAQLNRALGLFGSAGDRSGQARALANLGTVGERLADFGAAARRYRRALALFGQVDDRAAQAHVLTRLGAVELRLGRPGNAVAHLTEALALHRLAGHRFGEAWALSGLGEAELAADRPEQAVDLLARSVDLFRDVGDPAGEAWALTGLGTAETAAGRPGPAAEYHDLAGQIFIDIGERDGEAWARNGLGEAACAERRASAAVDHHQAALALAVGTGARDQQARAHAGLAVAWEAIGDASRAVGHRRHAAALLEALGAAAERRPAP